MEQGAVLVLTDGRTQYPIMAENDKASLGVLSATVGEPLGIKGELKDVDGALLLCASAAYNNQLPQGVV